MSDFIPESSNQQKENLSYRVRGAIYEVHKILGAGLYEECYQEALLRELQLRGIEAKGKVKLHVVYKGIEIKNAYEVDILVENKLIIELKSVSKLSDADFKQINNYLHLSNLYVGILVNFNVPYLEHNNIKRVYNPHASHKEDL